MDAPGATDKRVVEALRQALDTVKQDKIPCLRVSDRNTTGLRGDQWKALVKMQGASFKDDLEGAGGSFGIGKYAPFAVSSLRTVFYWTCYQDGNGTIEKFQGKSVLMSHHGENGETQGTGFYGVREGCRELTTSAIPECFRIVDHSGKPLCGTGVAIWGFRMLDSWRRRIAASAIENYFFAIGSGNLRLTIEPDETTSPELVSVDKTNLCEWFQLLADADDGGNTELRQAKILWEMSSTSPTAEKQDKDLGHCKLWIRVNEGLRKKVAFVRKSGMLVTTEQPGLLRFPMFKDFLALCVFEDPAGNELLRGMENPRHDKFEWQRLPEAERQRGKVALDRITRWIREQVGLQAGPPKGGRETVLSELAAYLPDLDSDEPLDSRDGPTDHNPTERGIGDRVTVSLKQIRRVGVPKGALEDAAYEGSSGDDSGGHGGGAGGGEGGEGGGDGSGDGDGHAGTGSKGGGPGPKTEIGLSDVRILPVEGQNRYRILLRPDRSCRVSLRFDEAGDSIMVPRSDIVATDPAISLDDWRVVGGQRCEVEVTAEGAPMGDRAWRVSAMLVQEGDRNEV